MSTAFGSKEEEDGDGGLSQFQTPKNTLREFLHELFLNRLTSQTTMSWPDWLQPHIDSFVQWVNGVLEYWDLDYLEYLIWLFLPIFIAFLLPIFLLFFIYGCVIFLHCYQLRHRIREAYASSYWDGARTSIASFWDGVGILWHGYEIRGLENLPDEGPALIVAYHGTLPLDLYYVIAKGILYKKRTIHCVGDKFVFKIPGWGKMCKVFCITPGTVEDCIANLNEGNLLIIAPGGVREALFSNPVTYEIMWGKRMGFAKVVLGANVPVIPMFTENCRDAFRTPRWGRRLFRPLYEKTRLPLCPIYGGFPVKMITHLGKPIHFTADSTPEQIKHTCRNAVNDLILKNQMMPGSILKAMFQRIRKKRPTTKEGGGGGGRDEQNDELNETEEKGQEGRRQNRRWRHQKEAEMGKNERAKGETIEMRPTNREMIASPLLMENDNEGEGNNVEEEEEVDVEGPRRNEQGEWVTDD